jgi:hypothetical protein
MNKPQFEILAETPLIATTRPTSRIVEITLTAPDARMELPAFRSTLPWSLTAAGRWRMANWNRRKPLWLKFWR